MFQRKSSYQFKWLSMILIFAVLLTACGSSESSVVGKWEVVSGTQGTEMFVVNASIGTLYEFLQDGTIVYGPYLPEYSFPDKTHMKIDLQGVGGIYEYTVSGDEMTLKNSTSQFVMVLKRYKEFNLDTQVIAGTWERSYPDDSGCFKGLKLESAPQEISFGTDGTLSLTASVYDVEGLSSSLNVADNFLMNGQYAVNGNNLHVEASGTIDDPGDTGIFGIGASPASQTQVQGSLDCAVIVSNSRLTFQNAQNQITLFLRSGK